MTQTVRGTLKLFVWLALIVAFASYSVTPAFARMPPRDSTTPKKAGVRDHTTRTKIVLLTELHPGEPHHSHVGELQIIDLKTLSSQGKFNKRSLSAEEMKALKSALTKAAAAKGCSTFEEEGTSWWGCMKGCLGDVGVSAYSLIICGATCVVGAIPLCAICIGVSVAVIEACGVGCAIYAN